MEKKKDVIGELDLLICLDSGTVDYDHFCLTTSLRGVVNFGLKVTVSEEGVHSGSSSGILPDSFRIARNLLE